MFYFDKCNGCQIVVRHHDRFKDSVGEFGAQHFANVLRLGLRVGKF